ncbi:selenocysteine-specific elongation factor-like [Dendronephthya gigantea]|uniref:selenocysteine-specific elongation factor-like n=1 Tax=Dendronephthya gigantea TaxID=151771 RepID=UPI00106B3F3F|nr:selenocysteine-specific elongation factor-like [Dendronephthya gigantea]
MASTEDKQQRILNFNVGVLGHIDSGKTSLSKALSTTASTASFDKNPQSKERGITLDLGFSSFVVPLPVHLESEPYDVLQFTLVDCPGHASLIKTIIGGAQIIDLMILVVDINKGIQTQTAECLVIGQITCDKMIVVLNKIDLIPEEKREHQIEKMTKRLSKTLEATKFAGSPIIAVAAKPDAAAEGQPESLGIKEMSELLTAQAYVPQRNNSGSFLFAVDHCFSVRGQGTVMTGTVLQGMVSLNDNVEIPSMKVVKKVKSMQMFRQPVSKVSQGDRAGICVTQFDPKLLERGLVCQPSSVPTIFAGIIHVKKIQYFKSQVASKAKFHITIGHETVMGKAQFFGLPVLVDTPPVGEDFNFSQEYVFQEELCEVSKKKDKETADNPEMAVNLEHQFAVLELERPVTCPNSSLVIGSRLDADIHLNTCRLAFHGKFLEMFTDKNYTETMLPRLQIFKTKSRVGEVERVVDEYSLIGKGLFKKETNMALFSNLKVRLSTGEAGVIEGSFGQSGKFKVRIPGGLSPESFSMMNAGQRKKGKGRGVDEGEKMTSVKIILDFKRYIFDPEKKMIQK